MEGYVAYATFHVKLAIVIQRTAVSLAGQD